LRSQETRGGRPRIHPGLVGALQKREAQRIATLDVDAEFQGRLTWSHGVLFLY
jgi:hypothetical protein